MTKYYFYIDVYRGVGPLRRSIRRTEKSVYAKDKHTAALVASYRYKTNITEADLFVK